MSERYECRLRFKSLNSPEIVELVETPDGMLQSNIQIFFLLWRVGQIEKYEVFRLNTQTI